MLFIDYSSAFNIIVPSMLITKLRTLGQNTSLCNWIMDFLMGRPQVVRTEEQALEVQSGMSLFGQALGAVRESVSRVAVQILIDNNKSNIHSLGQVLRSLHIQDLPLPPAPAVGDLVTRKVSSLSELLHVHTNFLRGKVRLLLTNAPACQQNST
ncbi:erythropoietin-like isoform X3 [Oncorhynchus keta]|uniref:erythropoietin-like isoform X3 n=1 Tax=Oncorhynchus keta TaxID=8018 RepID=UPI00227CABB1|nr:erythropoietin-like isoform X3 [Oncorhynchus keta]